MECHWERNEECDAMIQVPERGQQCAYGLSTYWLSYDLRYQNGLQPEHLFCSLGHLMEIHKSLMYSTAISQESVRIAFTPAVLNNLEGLVVYIDNAYLNTDYCEKVYAIAGANFGFCVGIKLI